MTCLAKIRNSRITIQGKILVQLHSLVLGHLELLLFSHLLGVTHLHQFGILSRLLNLLKTHICCLSVASQHFVIAKVLHLVCSSALLHFFLTSMSSKYTITPGIPCRTLSITRWKIPGVEETPYGKRLNWYKPLCVLITAIAHASSSNGTCKYALLRSSFEKQVPPASPANRSSILGIGYLSNLEAWLIVCLKSPHMQTVWSPLRTATIGACCPVSKLSRFYNAFSSWTIKLFFNFCFQSVRHRSCLTKMWGSLWIQYYFGFVIFELAMSLLEHC